MGWKRRRGSHLHVNCTHSMHESVAIVRAKLRFFPALTCMCQDKDGARGRISFRRVAIKYPPKQHLYTFTSPNELLSPSNNEGNERFFFSNCDLLVSGAFVTWHCLVWLLFGGAQLAIDLENRGSRREDTHRVDDVKCNGEGVTIMRLFKKCSIFTSLCVCTYVRKEGDLEWKHLRRLKCLWSWSV